jgi:carbonic anhydrase
VQDRSPQEAGLPDSSLYRCLRHGRPSLARRAGECGPAPRLAGPADDGATPAGPPGTAPRVSPSLVGAAGLVETPEAAPPQPAEPGAASRPETAAEARVEALCLANVVQQLEHLARHDCVAERLREGTLDLRGMYFHVGQAQAYVLGRSGGGEPVFSPVRPDVLAH